MCAPFSLFLLHSSGPGVGGICALMVCAQTGLWVHFPSCRYPSTDFLHWKALPDGRAREEPDFHSLIEFSAKS